MLPKVSMYVSTFASLVTFKDQDDAPPLEIGIEQAASLASLSLKNVEMNFLEGQTILDQFKVENSGFVGHLNKIEYLELSDTTNRSISLFKLDWTRKALFTNIKTDTVCLSQPRSTRSCAFATAMAWIRAHTSSTQPSRPSGAIY